ncbi:hypothetical protein BDV28DRAFT_60795 [Aspergillus coremiiformis]|uniref:BZIP domain-containing protein n=1 Tax=Aspergillus coremiiformis TaxID=138285 RepID=A0A5N6YWD2_9EURO|nr:hypothetical protein BDV28DRAFT_60795 [Aspergillus coremiiformis]
MDDDSQKKRDKLARVRENQRRSRARKQEHICHLEQKLVSLQEQAHHKDIEHRLTVQKLEAENRRLRLLLSHLGLANDTISEYAQAVEDPNMTQKVAIPALRRAQTNLEPQSQREKCRSTPSLYKSQTDMEVPQTEELRTSLNADVSQNASKLAQKPEDRQISTQSMCGCLPNEAARTQLTSYDILNTTLCAIAEELVKQYNRRGVDMAEIQKKLWSGFCNGVTTDEGCRVQNQILFQVLDEISGD